MARLMKSALGATVVMGSLALATGPAFGQSSTGGTIKVWAVANATSSSNKPSPVVLTGAIGDYGTTQSVNSSGKPDENGNYVKLTLKKGTFTVNVSQLNSAFSSAQPSDFNSSNCSATLTVGPVAVPMVANSGTGAYKGISGSVNLTAQLAIIAAKTKSGSCNTSSNANAAAGWGVITGSGTVAFS